MGGTLQVTTCSSWSLDPVSPVHTQAQLVHGKQLSSAWERALFVLCRADAAVLCVLSAAGADERPSQRDLNHVGVTAEWRQLGAELGVSTVTLDEVEYDHHREGIRELRSRMFEAWLKEGDPPQVTWRTLIRALEKIGLADKAEALVVEHGLEH